MEDRRILADGKEIWVIKAGFPDTSAKIWWSEYAFSNSLKKYLERLGYYVVIESYDEWYDEKSADVVVVLRGNREYFPDRGIRNCIYIMWNLSHPSTITDEEYNAYDMVCISSGKHAAKIKEKVNVPIKILPMCADTEIFFPDMTEDKEKEYDWIFVGNSRYVKRKSVTWSIEHGIPLKIWGANWKNFIPDSEKYVVADNIPNDKLPELYRNAKVTVDDHYDDMIQNGFINTRIIEAFACGLPVISDYSEVLTDMFGDAILCYRNEEEFVEQTKKIVEDYSAVKENVKKVWPVIREKYSFEACARQLGQFSEEIKAWEKKYTKEIKELVNFQEGVREGQLVCERKMLAEIKVSVIVCVHNTENYLCECMDSIIGQTLKEMEIICIDDGSEDSSLEILKEYAKKDERMSVYTQNRLGPSIARNRGMKKALGEYVYFIDSDDFLEVDALESLYQKSCENQLDILFFNGDTVFDKESDKEKYPGFDNYYLRKKDYPEKCTGAEMLARMGKEKEYRASVVMQMFRREFLEKAKLCFCPRILHEDNDFSFKAILLADNVGYLPRAYYKRRVHEESIMTGRTGIAHVYGYFRTLLNMIFFADRISLDDKAQKAVYDVLQGVLYNLKKSFGELTWQEQRAFDNLSGADKWNFKLYVQPEINGSGELKKIYREKEDISSVLQKMQKETEEMRRKLNKINSEKSEINAKLQKTYAEKSEINAKLQKTYAEKSEINRKLQITYGEKYERGLKIKSLEKELASIKKSRSYRLARVIGFPVRCMRKIVKKIKNNSN